MISDRLRVWAGWVAVVLSTAAISFWAFWGAAEAFHEGWFHRSLWRNLALTFVQYMAPSLVLLIPVAVALQWRRAALPVFTALAMATGLFFGKGVGITLIALPLLVFGVLFHFGDPRPRAWAWRSVLGLPLLTAILTGAVPGWGEHH